MDKHEHIIGFTMIALSTGCLATAGFLQGAVNGFMVLGLVLFFWTLLFMMGWSKKN